MAPMPDPFENDTDARVLLERLRWPDGPRCPRCDAVGSSVILIGGEKHSHREGLYQCKPCRRQFSVTVGTYLERQRMPWSTLVCLVRAFGAPYATRYERQPRPLPTLVEVAAQVRVNYRTASRMNDIIKRAAKSYKGYRTAFGAWPRKYMKSWTTNVVDVRAARRFLIRRDAMRKKGTHPEQHTVKSEGVLADMVSAQGRARAPLDRTEALLRLLLTAPPKKKPRKLRASQEAQLGDFP